MAPPGSFSELALTRPGIRRYNAVTRCGSSDDTGLNLNHPDLIGNVPVMILSLARPMWWIWPVMNCGQHCIAAVTNGIGGAGVAGLANIKSCPRRARGEHWQWWYPAGRRLYLCRHSESRWTTGGKGHQYEFCDMEPFRLWQWQSTRRSMPGKWWWPPAGNEGASWNARVGQYSYPASYDHVLSVAAD